ncbi:LutC/YkgG family protein [Peribacillus loiseleuriae]|uniref:LutC/YkgG family protein n=1 Tax=Peribacillus loiseleuriae TaxID=1679170 RepID=UPI003D06C72E
MAKGQMYNKESFLNNVAEKLNRKRRTENVRKPKWTYTPQYEVLKNSSTDELVDVLKNQCKVIHTQLIETTSSELNEQIQTVFKQYGVNSVVTWRDERFSEYGLDKALRKEWPNVHVWDPVLKEKNINAAEKADVGITFSDITLAESGTVVLFSHANKGRTVSLLPKTYIAIIAKSRVVSRMTQATSYIDEQIKKGNKIASCIDFITGPSNSADIELNLVVGVHGPIKATYIVVNDK